MEDSYFLCKMDEGQHINIKMIDGLCSEDVFKDMVLEDVRKSKDCLDDLGLELND
jgi:hypothetical protein